MAPILLPRSILRVTGADSDVFLDALLTRDVSGATIDTPVYAALLSPQGKLVADLFAHRARDGALLLDVAAALGESVLAKLTQLRLRKKVDLALASDLCVLADFSESAGPADPRLPDGSLGARTIMLRPQEAGDFEGYEARRIGLGVPDPVCDAGPEEVFALEALLEELNGVDFQKGCFIGQENVSRMKRRATTRRKFCRIRFDGPPPVPGTPVLSGDVALGDVRSGVDGVALALLRLDRALARPDPLTADGRPVRLDPPPFLILPPTEDA